MDKSIASNNSSTQKANVGPKVMKRPKCGGIILRTIATISITLLTSNHVSSLSTYRSLLHTTDIGVNTFSRGSSVQVNSSLRMVLMDPDTITARSSNRSSRKNSYKDDKYRSMSSPYLDGLIDGLETYTNDESNLVQTRKKKTKTKDQRSRLHEPSSEITTAKASVKSRRRLKTASAVEKSKIAISVSEQNDSKKHSSIARNQIDSRISKKGKSTASTNEHLLRPISSTSSSRSRKVTDGKRRSSTMPGFAERTSTGRIRRYNDGLRVFEEKSGRTDVRQILNKAETAAKRRQANAEAMYIGSASVPDSLLDFTSEIHKVTRITPTEEKELGSKTQEAIHLQEIFQKLEAELQREPTDEEWCAAAGKINMEAIRQAIEDGIDAKNQLVTSNLRMVQGVVNLYIRNGLGSQYNAADLMSEGVVALIRAAEKFEPSRGFRFSTYAMYWIRAAVKRSQILQSRVIHVPQRLHETNKKVVKVEKELIKELGRKPQKEELATAVGVTVTQLDRCRKAMAQECYSLDSAIENTLKPNSGDRKKDTMYDLIEAKSEDEESKKLDQLFLREDLINTLHRYLSPHEVDLILLRYGLMDERALPHGFSGPLTIADVSRLVGLKPDKVRRIINNCLRQLRHLIANEWEDFEKELP